MSHYYRKPPDWVVVGLFLAMAVPLGLQILSVVCFAALVSGCMKGKRSRGRR